MNVKWTVLVLIVTFCGYVPERTFAEDEAGDVVAPAIIGGTDAAKDAWPWQVQILRYGMFWCGGTILKADTILTAAHCTNGRKTWEITVVVGSYNRWNWFEWWTRGRRLMRVKTMIEHPDFDGLARNDVAIIKLRKPVKFSKYIQPMPQLANSSMNFMNRTCYVTGWGDTSGRPESKAKVLQQLNTPVITNAKCQENIFVNYTVTDDMICTDSEPKNTCYGDSGGPLQCSINNVWVHAGLVSWGNIDCRVGPSVYASTAVFIDWILSQI